MKVKLSPFLLLTIISLFFLVTRFYNLTQTPPAIYWDEASIGYNAYSILKTGHDEWGQSFPLEFKAFGEYKLPVYIYSLIPFLAVFGLQEWVIRLPAIIFSLGSVIVVYFLGKKIFESNQVGLLASFLLSISSWFFIFSRTGFEATAGLFFFCLGTLFLLKNSKVGTLLLGIICLILSMYSYNSFRIVAPLTLLVLSIYKFKILHQKFNFKFLLISLIFLAVLGLTFILVSKEGGERLSEIGIFSTNDKKVIIKNFTLNYFSHFSPKFLLISGDNNLRNQQPGFGELYYIEFLLMILGIYFIYRRKKTDFYIPIALLLIAPIPAAITRESPHALRSIAVVPIIALLVAFGISELIKFSKHTRLVLSGTLLILIMSFANYYYSYLTIYPIKSSAEWQYGYKQIFTKYNSQFNNFDHIIISDFYNQPYIFGLTYLKRDPNLNNSLIRNTTIRKETSSVKSFDKFIFSSINYYDFPKGKSLIFAHPSERMDEINYKETINNLDGSLAFFVYEYEK